MGKDIRWRSLVITIMVLLAAFSLYSKDIKLGLDLQGGTALTYTADTSAIDADIEKATAEGDDTRAAKLANERKGMINESVGILRNRLNNAGLEEIRVRKAGSRKILIQLPGMDASKAKAVKDALRRQGILEFRLVSEDKDLLKAINDGSATPKGWLLKELKEEQLLLESLKEDMRLTGQDIESVYPTRGDMGGDIVGITFTPAGSRKMSKLTREYSEKPGRKGRRLAILLDGRVRSAPVLKAEISTRCVIEGDFKKPELDMLINVLKAGSLPLKVNLDSENTVGSSIGSDSIRSGTLACVVGAIAVFIFMLIYYMFAGLVASIALLINFGLLLGLLAFFRATLTLPGIAGLVLTLGMAVDANVLIFERIREELKKGKQLGMAIRDGYDRAFVTIIDSNLTTLITAFILTVVGTEAVKGFGTTLLIGILTSMFTALFITKTIFLYLLDRGILNSFRMLAIFKGESKIRFSKLRFVALIGSIIVIAAGIFMYTKLGNKNYDMDFNGGSSVQITLSNDKAMKIDDVRKRINEALAKETFELETKSKDAKEKSETEQRIADLRKKIADAKIQSYWGTIEQQAELKGKARNFTFETEIGNDDDLSLFVSFLKRTFKADIIPPAVESRRISMSALTEADKQTEEYKSGKLKWEATVNFQNPVYAEYAINALDDNLKTSKKAEFFAIKFPEGYTGSEKINSIKMTFFKQPIPGKNQDDSLTAENTEVNNTIISAVEAHNAKVKKNSPDKVVALSNQIPRKNLVGAQVAQDMKSHAVWAITWACFFICGYIWFRFQFVWGIAAVIALVHDVLIAIAVISLNNFLLAPYMGWPLVPINLVVVAALLTIVGYSINDSIVVYDRIRENLSLPSNAKSSIREIADLSINQTLSRTVLTSLTTLLVVIAMLVMGGSEIYGFAFTMCIGIITGTYSSIFVAAPVILIFEEWFGKKEKEEKK